MKIELRDYQTAAFDKAREHIKNGKRRIMIVAPCGAGKTVIASAIMEMARDKGNRATFVVDRLSLLGQSSETFDRYGLRHGVIQGDHPRWAPYEKIQICSIQTLAKRRWPESQVDVFDECFPGTTEVETTQGKVRIDQVRQGDSILCASGEGVVESVFSKRTNSIATVRLSDGRTIQCTPDHPFFTGTGWVEARALAGSSVFCVQDMPSLWGGTWAEEVLEQEIGDLEVRVKEEFRRKNLLQSILLKETEQSNAQPEISVENEGNLEGYRSQAIAEGWERLRANKVSSARGESSWRGLGNGVRVCAGQKAGGFPEELQDRHSESGSDDSRGAGRVFTPNAISPRARFEEGFAPSILRVESVEVEEPGSDQLVYNLRVKGHPSYFADGVLVHNCHVLHRAHKARITSGDAVTIGVTATPFTKGLANYFDAVINVTTTRQLINEGWLSDYKIYSCAEPDMTGVKVKSTGEWDDAESSKKALEVVGDVVAEYLKHGEERKFICSGVDTAHVEELHRQFGAAGILTATYTYKDTPEDREETTKEFRKPNSMIRGLITVTAASRGFDIPDVSCIIMARPLRKSLAEHIQLFGRGLRIADGKTDCKILCHSGNCARFFDACETFFDNGAEALDDGKKKEKKKAEKPEVEPMKCPSCNRLHNPMPVCPNCGHQYPKREAIKHVAGTLKEMIAGGQRHELTRKVWPMVCGYVRERREGEAARKQALAIFKELTNTWPSTDFDRTPSAPVSTEVRNRIRANQIRYSKRRTA